MVQKSEIYVVRERPLTPISNLTKNKTKEVLAIFPVFFHLFVLQNPLLLMYIDRNHSRSLQKLLFPFIFRGNVSILINY